MKFGQKMFFSVLILFCISIAIVSGTLLGRSDAILRETAVSSSRLDISVIRQSIYDRLCAAEKFYQTFNAANISFYLRPYDRYYAEQGVFFLVYSGRQLIYSSYPQEISDQDVEALADSSFTQRDGKLFLSFRNRLPDPLNALSVIFLKDVTYIQTVREQIRNVAIAVCLGTTAALALLLLGLVSQLTKPIRRLNRAAKQIAQGDYSCRVSIHTRDEIGNFAQTFNGMAQSIEEHVELLQSMTDERQRFINHMTHELRTPITAIVGYGEYLENYDAPEEKRKLAVHYIAEQGKRLKNLSEKLLLLLQTQRRAAAFENVNLSDVVCSVRSTLAPQLSEKGVKLLVALEAERLYGDRDLIEMLIQNLLENAVNASPRDETVRFRAFPKDERVCIQISDHGAGIPEEERNKILEPFYRMKRPQAQPVRGLGLGMTLCKQICDLHGTKMEIRSSDGQGTTISIELTTSS